MKPTPLSCKGMGKWRYQSVYVSGRKIIPAIRRWFVYVHDDKENTNDCNG